MLIIDADESRDAMRAEAGKVVATPSALVGLGVRTALMLFVKERETDIGFGAGDGAIDAAKLFRPASHL